MIGVTSAGEGSLTYWRQHDRLVTANASAGSQHARRGRIRNVTKTVNSDKVEYET